MASNTAIVRSDTRFDLSIRPQKQKPQPRVIVYGEPGVGKTTFGTSAPDVILIPTEDGALGVDVPRIPNDGKCETWGDVLLAAKALRGAKHDYRWAALDTLNGAAHLCAEAVCKRDFGGRWTTIKDHEGYDAFGRGDKATAHEFRELLSVLDDLQQQRGMGVILLAHAGLHKQGNALGADYYKFGAEMPKAAWALTCGWADQVAHACREVRAATREGEKKAKASAIGDERWLVFEGGPGRDAKSRVGYEMPERILLSWDDYERALKLDRVGELVKQAAQLLTVAPEKQQAVVRDRLGGEATNEALRAIGARKLEALIGWLLSTAKKEE
jgi:hypothetical protein